MTNEDPKIGPGESKNSGSVDRSPDPTRNDGIKYVSCQDALQARKVNASSDWCKYDSDGPVAPPGSALQRFNLGGFFKVENKAKFKISRAEKVYTIGSCFAREIERALVFEGFNVPTSRVSIDPSYYRSPTRYLNTVLNKYNPYSMAYEILRGLNRLTLIDRGLIPVGDKWYDPSASHTDPLPRASVEILRDILDRVTEEVKTSSVFILTLGYTEAWFDTRTNVAFNGICTAMLRTIQNYLGFRNLRHSECKVVLRDAFQEIKSQIPSAKIIVTVSPIPLTNTFTELDIVSANTYSKSTLRSVAQELFEDLDYVDYFPSFEMVTASPRYETWFPDQVHVEEETVRRVVKVFKERYLVRAE